MQAARRSDRQLGVLAVQGLWGRGAVLQHQLSRRWIEALCFAPVIVLAAWLRLDHLGADSLWLDEAASWDQARQPILGLLRATSDDNYPPLHNLILHVAIALFGDSEWSLRLPSALLGTATVGLIMLTAWEIRGFRAAVTAGILMALLPFDIWYSQEARMYALMEFASLAFAWSILRYGRRPSQRAAWWTAAAALPLLYSHLFGSFVWISLCGAAALKLRDDRTALTRLVMVQFVAAILFLPWAVILLHRSDVVIRGGLWVPPLTVSRLLDTYRSLAGGTILAALTMLIGVALAIRSAFDVRMPRDERSAIGLLLTWLIVPLMVTAVISLVSVSLFLDRYLIGIVPAMILLAAIGFDSVDGSLPLSFRRLRLAWPIATIVIVGLAWSWHFDRLPKHRDDWRGAARSIDGVITPADCVVLVRGFIDAPLRYYRRDLGQCLVKVWNPAEVALPAEPPPAIFVFSWSSAGDDDIVVDGLAKQGWRGEPHAFSKVKVWHLTRS